MLTELHGKGGRICQAALEGEAAMPADRPADE